MLRGPVPSACECGIRDRVEVNLDCQQAAGAITGRVRRGAGQLECAANITPDRYHLQLACLTGGLILSAAPDAG